MSKNDQKKNRTKSSTNKKGRQTVSSKINAVPNTDTSKRIPYNLNEPAIDKGETIKDPLLNVVFERYTMDDIENYKERKGGSGEIRKMFGTVLDQYTLREIENHYDQRQDYIMDKLEPLLHRYTLQDIIIYKDSRGTQGTIPNPEIDEVLEHFTIGTISRSDTVDFLKDFGANWRDRFTAQQEINNLFYKIGITDETSINIGPTASTDRITLLVDTKNMKSQKTSKVIIDVTTGSPTWVQFIDVTYDLGTGTDIRIIVYDHDDDGFNPLKAAGNWMQIFALVYKNNCCGVRTFLVQAGLLSREGAKPLDYHVVEKPDVVEKRRLSLHKPSGATLPTKRDIQIAEFWVGYVGRALIEQRFDPLHYLSKWILLGGKVSEEAKWTEEGLILTLISDDLKAVPQLREDMKEPLKRKYSDCPVNFIPNTPKGAVIAITMLKIPVTNLINMDPKDKWDYAKIVRDAMKELEHFVHQTLYS